MKNSKLKPELQALLTRTLMRGPAVLDGLALTHPAFGVFLQRSETLYMPIGKAFRVTAADVEQLRRTAWSDADPERRALYAQILKRLQGACERGTVCIEGTDCAESAEAALARMIENNGRNGRYTVVITAGEAQGNRVRRLLSEADCSGSVMVMLLTKDGFLEELPAETQPDDGKPQKKSLIKCILFVVLCVLLAPIMLMMFLARNDR